jgi:hypothetical protein
MRTQPSGSSGIANAGPLGQQAAACCCDAVEGRRDAKEGTRAGVARARRGGGDKRRPPAAQERRPLPFGRGGALSGSPPARPQAACSSISGQVGGVPFTAENSTYVAYARSCPCTQRQRRPRQAAALLAVDGDRFWQPGPAASSLQPLHAGGGGRLRAPGRSAEQKQTYGRGGRYPLLGAAPRPSVCDDGLG